MNQYPRLWNPNCSVQGVKKTKLVRFVELGQRSLAKLEEGSEAYTRCQVRLYNAMLQDFPNGIDRLPEESLKELLTRLGFESISDAEDTIIDAYLEREYDVDASDFEKHAGSNDNDDCENSRGGYKFKDVPVDLALKAKGTAILREHGETFTSRGISSIGMPDQAVMPRGMVANPEIHDSADAVSIGDFFLEECAEKDNSYGRPTRPYFDRNAKAMFEAAQAWKRQSPAMLTCERCGQEFEGRAGTKYCKPNCRKRAHEGK